MSELKGKKSGIAKKLRKGILSPCYKSTKTKHTVSDKHDLDNIDNGTLSFDSRKYLKKKHSDVDTINTNVSRFTNTKTESPLSSEITETDSYLKKRPQNKGKEKAEEVTEIIDVESSDSDDDVPLSQISKIKTAAVLKAPNLKANRQESVESKVSYYTANNGVVNSNKKDDVINSIKEENIKMPLPNESKDNDATGSVSIPVQTEVSDNKANYIVEEIVTEEIINGKKRITTQTITRRAKPQDSSIGITQQPSFKMPVAVGSKMEPINIPEKMTSTTTEIPSNADGIVEMPMNLPKPSDNVPNIVDSELNNIPKPEIVEDQPSSIPMPSIPVVVGIEAEPPKGEITEHIVSSPKLMAEENVPKFEHPLPIIPSVEPGFNINVSTQPKPVEAGFNFNNTDSGNINIQSEAIKTSEQDEAGFNFKITDETNMPIAMPVPVNNGFENMPLDNSPPVPNLLALSSANKKQESQQGYLEIPLPLPPSAIEDNKVMDDSRSDISHDSKKGMVSSPKIFTADEEIQFKQQLDDKERLEHEEALKNEVPLGNIPMPKTPSTYFKNNNLSDNENSLNENDVQPEIQKMTLTVVNQDEPVSDSDSDDDEKLINIKKQYEQKKRELEATIGNLQETINETNEEIKNEIVKEEIPEVPAVPVEVKEEIPEVPVAPVKEKEEKPEVPVAPVEEKEEKPEVPVAPVEEKEEKPEVSVAPVEEKEEKPEVPVAPVEVKEEKLEVSVAPVEVKEEKPEVSVVPVEVKEEKPASIISTSTEEIEEEDIKSDNGKGKMEELKNQISSSIKKHQRTMSNSMQNLKDHLKGNKDHKKENKQKSEKKKEEIVTESNISSKENDTETEIIGNETPSVVPGYASSDTSIDTFISNSKKSNRPKSIKSFFGFNKKDKKDKKEKKEKKTIKKIEEETIPEFPINNLSVNTGLKEKRGSIKSNDSNSPFSFKRLVSPFSATKRRASSASLSSKINNKKNEKSEHSDSTPNTTVSDVPIKNEVKNTDVPTNDTTKTGTTKTEIVQESSKDGNSQQKVLTIVKPSTGDNMNKVIADVQTQQPKFVIPEEALERVESDKQKDTKKESEDDDKSSIYSVSSQSSVSSSSSSLSSSASSASSSSSDEEVLGNLINKKQNASTIEASSVSHTAPITINNQKQSQNYESNLNKNYANIENDDFVSLMMVQRMLSSSVDRTSLNTNTLPSSYSEIPSNMISPYSFVDVEAEKKKSYSKPKAVITTVNPYGSDNTVGTPRSTILYKFDEKPTLEAKNNLYKNDFASRSVGSLPIDVAKEEVKSSPKQRMIELNLDNSFLIDDKEMTEADKRKSTLLDSNLMQMFDDIHNLSLDDITSRYTKPSMIQCDIGPSFLDEVMGSLSMDKR
ncbi:hypothetical protein BCR36DRAFT_587788 [Piromyces finnis]|uniref:Uncharacterized protein n=1 Tax=Piromyces finnis TaxID=1754191 RepID=A0A1Y1UUW4_9FUNG|nr:hypothetical protein BCR36DRAFT_587788 [Piromyces finnis]|eukprot:ORX41763.1 hypothetical protein BCR36DRAFT_587788 [Piromyces finnis]